MKKLLIEIKHLSYLNIFEYLFHSFVDKLLLLDELFWFRVLPELDGLDETVLKLLGQTMRCLHLDVGVPNAYQVCY